MPQIIIGEITAHLASYTFLQEILIKKNTSLSRLYQPPFSQNIYH